MKFYCKQCEELQTCSLFREIIKAKEDLIQSTRREIDSRDEILAAKEGLINELRSSIAEIRRGVATGSGKLSYSDTVKKTGSEVVVVKPKSSTQESSITKQVVERKINPSELRIGIEQIKYVREGGVAIKCGRREDIKSVTETIRREMGEEYEVKIPLKKNPKIKIFNVDKKLLDATEEFFEKIVLQNTITTPSEKLVMKIVDRYEDKKSRTNVVMEVDQDT